MQTVDELRDTPVIDAFSESPSPSALDAARRKFSARPVSEGQTLVSEDGEIIEGGEPVQPQDQATDQTTQPDATQAGPVDDIEQLRIKVNEQAQASEGAAGIVAKFLKLKTKTNRLSSLTDKQLVELLGQLSPQPA